MICPQCNHQWEPRRYISRHWDMRELRNLLTGLGAQFTKQDFVSACGEKMPSLKVSPHSLWMWCIGHEFVSPLTKRERGRASTWTIGNIS